MDSLFRTAIGFTPSLKFSIEFDESVFAFCDTEDSIINGGYETDIDPNNRFQVRSDVQFPFTPTNSWFVNVQNIGDNPLFFIAQAVCFDNPPAHIP